jgi:hypothetical protein
MDGEARTRYCSDLLAHGQAAAAAAAAQKKKEEEEAAAAAAAPKDAAEQVCPEIFWRAMS